MKEKIKNDRIWERVKNFFFTCRHMRLRWTKCERANKILYFHARFMGIENKTLFFREHVKEKIKKRFSSQKLVVKIKSFFFCFFTLGPSLYKRKVNGLGELIPQLTGEFQLWYDNNACRAPKLVILSHLLLLFLSQNILLI